VGRSPQVAGSQRGARGAREPGAPLGASAATSHASPADVAALARLQGLAGNRAACGVLDAGRLQRKLAVGRSDDAHEREAERVAASVARSAPTPASSASSPRRPCACGGTCDGCRGHGGAHAPGPVKLRRRPDGPASAPERAAPPEVDAALRTPGHALDADVRAHFEPRLGVDLSAVRVHRDGAAAASARAVDALAYTVGHHVAFAEGRYDPHSAAGRELLAHELTHVVQQTAPDPGAGDRVRLARAPEAPLLRRAPDPAAKAGSNVENPPPAAMMVTLGGIIFEPGEGARYDKGPKAVQLIAVAVRRLVGPQYTPEVAIQAYHHLTAAKLPTYGGLAPTSYAAKGGERMERTTLVSQPALVLVKFLRSKKLTVGLTPEQIELLDLGLTTRSAWNEVGRAAIETNAPLPGWYTLAMFQLEAGQHASLLREHHRILVEYWTLRDQQAAWDLMGSAHAIRAAIVGPIDLLDTIRKDTALATAPSTKDVYASLWELPKDAAAGGAVRVPTKVRSPGLVAIALGWVRSQQTLADEALLSHEKRVALLERFDRYRNALLYQPPSHLSTDQVLRDAPATANFPPFPSSLTVVPPLGGLLFEAALDTDHRFSMEVLFPHVADALGHWAFAWERVRVPDEKVGRPVDTQAATVGEVSTVRFNRADRYLRADVERAVADVRTDLGPPGVGAVELVAVNAMLRYLGTGIGLGIDLLTMPKNQRLIVFPEPGLYLVRAIMRQVRTGDEEIVRAPSVAYMPVVARDPDDMAASGAKSAAEARSKAPARIAEIEGMLVGRPPGDERTQLEEELRVLKLSLGPVAALLEYRREKAAERVAEIEAGKREGELEDAKKELEHAEKLVALREKRKLGATESPVARFVSDLGRTIPLTLEIEDRATKPGTPGVEVYVSDITTPKSGAATGRGATRDAAILDGVRSLLQDTHGYGRGRVAIVLGGTSYTLRIEASRGSLLMESIENVTLALSVAALAAAPITGGASLSLLIPLGIVGAVPSAYRIAQRVDAGTFAFDLENAMDMVNILSSFLAIGRLGAGAVRAVHVGKAILFVGYGADAVGGILLGVDTVMKLQALASLPAGEREAAILMLLGQVFLQAGMLAAGSYEERAQQLRAEAGAGAKPHVDAAGTGTPGDATPPAAGPKVGGTVDEMLRAAKGQRDMDRLGDMDDKSRLRIEADEQLRTALAESPFAAEAFKKCASPCFPPEMTADQVRRANDVLARLADTGEPDWARIKTYFHNQRADLDRAIANIAGVGDMPSLNAWLDFYNKPNSKITPLPPKGDPKQVSEQQRFAHDVGVTHGRQYAVDQLKLTGVGFDNPIKIGGFDQGFDDVMRAGPTLDVGDVYIVEYKGGSARLKKGQMELEWVMGNIHRLYTDDGETGKAWARILAKALREGRLKGVVVTTRLDGRIPKPTEATPPSSYPATKLPHMP
jgi:hypothetical protein